MTRDSIYYRARAQASAQDGMYSNRQRAAEQLYVSTEALSDYETGATLPPCDVVQRMIEVYGTDWLRRWAGRYRFKARLRSGAHLLRWHTTAG